MGGSINGGNPKWPILKGHSLVNHPFWGTPIYGTPYKTIDIRYHVVSQPVSQWILPVSSPTKWCLVVMKSIVRSVRIQVPSNITAASSFDFVFSINPIGNLTLPTDFASSKNYRPWRFSRRQGAPWASARAPCRAVRSRSAAPARRPSGNAAQTWPATAWHRHLTPLVKMFHGKAFKRWTWTFIYAVSYGKCYFLYMIHIKNMEMEHFFLPS